MRNGIINSQQTNFSLYFTAPRAFLRKLEKAPVAFGLFIQGSYPFCAPYRGMVPTVCFADGFGLPASLPPPEPSDSTLVEAPEAVCPFSLDLPPATLGVDCYFATMSLTPA